MFLKTHAMESQQYQVIQKKRSSISQWQGKITSINIISVVLIFSNFTMPDCRNIFKSLMSTKLERHRKGKAKA